jgi:hypothetical protein
MIYNKINEFCSVRNLGSCKKWIRTYTKSKISSRTIRSEGIEYQLDKFEVEESPWWSSFQKMIHNLKKILISILS